MNSSRQFVIGWALILGAFSTYLGLFALREGVGGDFADNWLIALYLWPLYLVGFLLFRRWPIFRRKLRRREPPQSWLMPATLPRALGTGLVFVMTTFGFFLLMSASSTNHASLSLRDSMLWPIVNLGAFGIFYLITCAPAYFFSETDRDV
jgi:hypothetical protein